MNHQHSQQPQQQSSPSASSIPNATGGESDRAFSERSSAITRTGKIARLPQAIRQRLNERLADGEPQHLLVAWLNEQAVVRERLERFHGGRPITEQNLSDWRAGGFRDWERHQESRGMLRELLQEAEEIGAELGEGDLLEKATNSVALALLRLLKDAMAGDPKPEQRQAVLQIARELDRMRRVGHEGQRVRLLVDKAHEPANHPVGRHNWKKINGEVAEIEEEQKKQDAWLEVEAEMLRAEYVTGMVTQTLTPERRKYIEGFFAYHQPSVKELDLEPLPAWREPKVRAAKKRPQPQRKAGKAKATSPAKSTGGGGEKTPSTVASQPSTDCAASGENPE